MKFYVGSKETGYHFKYEIERRYEKNKGFVSVAEIKDLFRESSEDEEHQIGWDNDSNLVKKMRVRECKDGWFLYLPEPNAKICFNKNDTKFDEESYEKSKVIANIEPSIDVTVFETKIFENLLEVLDLGFDRLCNVLWDYSGNNLRPCMVKAKKSGRKEERQDRPAKFHRWADLSKGVQQVVAIVEFEDGHIEQVQPDRVIFKEEE